MAVTVYYSLPNMSNDIRWSLDLRWQKPDQSYGFYGLKQGTLMRTSKDPKFKVNWEQFDQLGRHDLLRKACVVCIDFTTLNNKGLSLSFNAVCAGFNFR